MSLESYPHDVNVTGVDLSESMLAEAEQQISRREWSHIKVMPMNAEDLRFPDSSFDFVTSFHTISVVSDPRKMMFSGQAVTHSSQVVHLAVKSDSASAPGGRIGGGDVGDLPRNRLRLDKLTDDSTA